MADTDRIKSNLEKMIGMGAPEADIDTYLSSEGFKSAEEWRSAIGIKPPSAGRQAVDAVVDFADRTAGYARTLGNDMLGGVIGLPRLAAEGIDWLGKKDAEHGGTGVRVPESVKKMLPTPEAASRRLNLPPPPITGGGLFNNKAYDEWLKTKDVPRKRYTSGSEIVDAGASGLMGAMFTGGASLPALFASVGGPVLSEVAGEVAHTYDQQHGTNWETPVRIVAGVKGAAGGAAVPSVVRKVGTTAKSVVEPFTAAGRDKVVGQTLFNMADDPAAAIARGEAYSPPVPGFNLPAPQAMRDDALMATQNALHTPGSRFGQRSNANNVALSEELDRLGAGLDPKAFVAEIAKQDAAAAMRAQAALDALPAGADAATAGQAIRDALSGRAESLTAARSKAVKPLYEAVESSEIPVGQWDLMKWTADKVATEKGPVRDYMQRARDLLTDVEGNFPRATTAADMDKTRKALGALIKEAPDDYTRGLLMEMRGKIDKAMSVVPEEAQAIRTFADMSRPLDPFSADKGAKNVARVVERDQFGKVPMLPAENVPSQFFRPGDGGGATMKEFMATAPDAKAVDAMKSFIADKARASGDAKAFLQKHGPAIEALDPGLARQLEDAAATATISSGFKAGPAGKFLNGDLDAAVRSTLGAPDATKRMQSLRMSVGGDPEAVKGLQRAVLDDFRTAVQMPVKESAQDVPALSADKASKWLTANKGAVANVLSPDQVKGLDAITRALKDQAQTAVKTAGPNTAQNLATMSILEAALWKGAGDAAWLAPVRKVLNFPYGGANEKALERLTEVLLDPKAAAALMKKATPSNVKLASPILGSITRGAAVGPVESLGAAR